MFLFQLCSLYKYSRLENNFYDLSLSYIPYLFLLLAYLLTCLLYLLVYDKEQHSCQQENFIFEVQIMLHANSASCKRQVFRHRPVVQYAQTLQYVVGVMSSLARFGILPSVIEWQVQQMTQCSYQIAVIARKLKSTNGIPDVYLVLGHQKCAMESWHTGKTNGIGYNLDAPQVPKMN